MAAADLLRIATSGPAADVSRGLLTAGVFLVTLQSYYFYQIGAAPLPLIGTALIAASIALVPGVRISPRLAPCLALLALLQTLSVLIAALDPLGSGVRANSVFGAVFGLFALLIFDALRTTAPDAWRRALRSVLAVHLAVFAAQASIYYLAGVYIDLLEPVTGEAQRFASNQPGFIRPTGLFNEPATFALTTAVLLLASHGFARRLDGLGWAALACMAATLSLSGLLLAAAYAGLQLLGLLRRPGLAAFVSILSPVAIVGLALFVAAPALEAALERLANVATDTSFLARFGVLTAPRESWEWETWIGAGLAKEVYADALLGSHVGSCLTYLVYHFGLAGSAVFIATLAAYQRAGGADVRRIFFWGALLTATSLPLHPLFWLVLPVLPRDSLR